MLSNKMRSIIGVLLVVITSAGCGSGNSNSPTISSDDNGVQLVAISITPTNSQMAANTGQRLAAIGIYSDSSKKDLTDSVTWSSSDTTVIMFSAVAAISVKASRAMLSQGGIGHAYAYGIKAGHANIRATLGSAFDSSSITVTDATLVTIGVTPANPGIANGTTIKLAATGTFSDNTTQDLTAQVIWSSSNTDVATIGASGLAASTAAGTTTVTATSGSIAGSTLLTVNPATLVSIAVTPSNPGIANGTTVQLAATGTFSDNTTQDLTAQVIWSSSNTGVATIGASGLAASTAAGSTTVTATSGSITGSTLLTVNLATLVSITVAPSNPGIANGTTVQFTATGTFSDNTTQDLTALAAWSSSKTGVATVGNAAGTNGLATSISTGTTAITAASGSINGSTLLTVNPATLVSISIVPSNPTNAKGTTRQFTATGTYSDGTTQDLTTSVTWNSSNPAVSAISNAAGSNGLASCLAAGTSTITAISGSVDASIMLTVTPATLLSISVTPANPNIASGATQQFTASGTYSDGTTQTLTASVTWSSSNTAAATISNAAGSNGLASGAAAGTTTIKATSGSISGSAALTVAAVTTTGSATLAWDAPATNTDGTPLTDLAGFKVYYGTSSGNYTAVVDVGNVLSVTIDNLASGQTYYFTVTDYDTSNIESSYSNEVSKSIS